MVKLNLDIKEFIILINVILILGLCYMFKKNKKQIIEPVTNSNCCGGIEPGVHYQETDTRPPEYVRKCFKSERDQSDGHISYTWDSFPCTRNGSNCCGDGECIPTTKGGYCKKPNGENTIYNRGGKEEPYIQYSDDNLLDINNTIDMKDYFYKRSSKLKGKNLTPDMIAFLKRRDKNFKYIQEHNIENRRAEIKAKTEAKLKASEEKKNIQIKDTIIAIHLIMIIIFSLVIKELIINRIDSYYDFINLKYLEFLGKK
jgi:hypothetical protein